MKSSVAGQQKQGVRRNEQKWSPDLWGAGWIGIPNIIIEKQLELGLDATDVNVLLHLLRYWWHRDNLPHPSKKTIAQCMGVNPSTVRRHVAKMEKRGLLQRVGRMDEARGQKTNYYDFSGLIAAATPLALEAVAIKERRQQEDAQRLNRKRGRLAVVTPADGQHA
jgi:DNA-binding MarR family transcriptional regulator